MDQRLLFSGLALELEGAFCPLSLIALSAIVDSVSISKLYLFSAEASLVLTAVSVVVIAIGLLRKGALASANSQVLIVLSTLAIFGTLASAWWVLGVASWASMDCGPFAPWKCNMVQAGTYVGYYFFPAIAVPIITLVSGAEALTSKSPSIACSLNSLRGK